jgi:hypothetical protein
MVIGTCEIDTPGAAANTELDDPTSAISAKDIIARPMRVRLIFRVCSDMLKSS